MSIISLPSSPLSGVGGRLIIRIIYPFQESKCLSYLKILIQEWCCRLETDESSRRRPFKDYWNIFTSKREGLSPSDDTFLQNTLDSFRLLRCSSKSIQRMSLSLTKRTRLRTFFKYTLIDEEYWWKEGVRRVPLLREKKDTPNVVVLISCQGWDKWLLQIQSVATNDFQQLLSEPDKRE